MTYTAIWVPGAEQDLAGIWMDAPDRQQASDVANRIDGLLAQRPELLGESREGSVRVAFEEHLGFEFEVLMQDRIVYVLAIWPLRWPRGRIGRLGWTSPCERFGAGGGVRTSRIRNASCPRELCL